jgi:formylglycine-generating enzyme required for sulfatase activity
MLFAAVFLVDFVLCFGTDSGTVIDTHENHSQGILIEKKTIEDIVMVSIPAGTFSMGQKKMSEPVHTVTLSAFEMSEYEITQGQYKAITGLTPSYFTGDDMLPVEQVSWWEAIKYCNTLSRRAGLAGCYNEITGSCDFTKNGFRLPTEAEWEYACRAGTTTLYNLGDNESDLDSAGWYIGNSVLTTTKSINTNGAQITKSTGKSMSYPVGKKAPNAWGLYDMHGNVSEWCNDMFGNYSTVRQINPTGAQADSSRVIRGGAWSSPLAFYCQSAYRSKNYPDVKRSYLGFRVVRRP